MPEWIHNRAEHLLAKNPDMPKSQAFAIATQQSHALGKSPKSYGTKRGRQEAKAKYDTPKDDVKKANPGGLDSPKLAAMRDELAKQADRLFGGKADDKTDKDFDKKQLAMGEEVEQEHAKGDRTLAREIARDHLQEIPDYYTRLKRMEDAAPKRKEAGAKEWAQRTSPLHDAYNRWFNYAGERGLGSHPVLGGPVRALDKVMSADAALSRKVGLLKRTAPVVKETVAEVADSDLPADVLEQLMKRKRASVSKVAGMRRWVRLMRSIAKDGRDVPLGVTPKYKAFVAAGEKVQRRGAKIPWDREAGLAHPLNSTRGWVHSQEKMQDIFERNGGLLRTTPEADDYYEAARRATNAKIGSAQSEEQSMLRKIGMDPDHPYLLDQVGKPKTRNLSAMPPDKSLVVKKAAATGVFGLPLERDPMAGTGQKNAAKKRLAQSQKIGVPEAPKMPKTKPLPMKVASALEKQALGYYGTRAAIGAGIGALGGATAAAASGGPEHRVRRAVLGGVGGGVLGAGVGYAAPMYLRGRQGSISRTGEVLSAPLSRGEAARSVVQQARSDTGQLMQRAGERLQMKGRATQGAVAREQMTAAREAARPKTVHTHLVQPGQFSPGVPTDLRQEISEIPQWGHGAYGHQKAAAVKAAWAESEYSGGTGFGNYGIDKPNSVPAFVNPPVKTAGPPSEQGPRKKAAITKLAAMADELMKLNAVNAITIQGRASQARRVGQPSVTPPPGPSIGDISKPIGYGEKIPGATKTGAAYPKALT